MVGVVNPERPKRSHMTEGMSQGSKDSYFKLYTHQAARLIQLEEENRHLRSALADMRSILVARQGQPSSQTEDWHKALITIIDAALPDWAGRLR
jgi:hypothetical protein